MDLSGWWLSWSFTNNMNIEDSLILSGSWTPVLHLLGVDGPLRSSD